MVTPNLVKDKVLGRSPETGGVTCLSTGALGSGKTSLLVHFARRILERHPYEYVIWRGDEKAQFVKFLDAPHDSFRLQVFVPAGRQVMVKYRPSPDSPVQSFPIDEWKLDGSGERLRVLRYENNNELLEKMKPGWVNVPILSDEETVELMEFLQRELFDWSSFFVDEVESFAPFGAAGRRYEWALRFTEVLKHSRKFRMSVYTDTQCYVDCFWSTLPKYQFWNFLKGSRVPESLFKWLQLAVMGLNLGEGWCATIASTEREKFKFPPYIQKTDLRLMVKEEKPDHFVCDMCGTKTPMKQMRVISTEGKEYKLCRVCGAQYRVKRAKVNLEALFREVENAMTEGLDVEA